MMDRSTFFSLAGLIAHMELPISARLTYLLTLIPREERKQDLWASLNDQKVFDGLLQLTSIKRSNSSYELFFEFYDPDSKVTALQSSLYRGEDIKLRFGYRNRWVCTIALYLTSFESQYATFDMTKIKLQALICGGKLDA